MDRSTLKQANVLPTLKPDAQTGSQPSSSSSSSSSSSPSLRDTLVRWNARIEEFAGVEARGIARVLPSERQPEAAAAYMQMALLWFSTNLTANNLTLAMLGPLVYDLGFTDSALLAVFGSLVGCAGAAYMGDVWAKKWEQDDGMCIIARYFMGYWPSKICCLLNIVIMLGYGMIDCIVGGQILSAVSGGHMTVIAGIVIVAVITWIVTVFGISVFHVYERWAWLPQVLVLFILFGCPGPHFDTSIQTAGDAATVSGNRLSYFSLCLSAPVAWAPSAADYFVYYPEHTAPWKTFVMAFLGMGAAYSIVDLLGVGLASGSFTNPAWDAAYNTSESALIVAGFDGLGGFGNFCSVIVSLGVIANNIPGTYSAALGFQVMGRRLATVPRWIWTTISVIIYLVCALGGRNSLFDIFEDWLALMGYWLTIFLCIVFEEQLLFRRSKDAFEWDAWNDPARLPLGLAAMAAFLVGWAGVIICMDQVYYVGPVAAMVGEYGADMGIWVGCAFTLVIFPGSRWLELRAFKR